MKERLISALLGAAAGAVIAYPQIAFAAAKAGLEAFCLSVLPALLPLLFLMLLLSSRVKRSVPALIPMGLLCGSPGGARLLAPLCADRQTACFCAAVCGTMSPMFFLGTLSAWAGVPQAGPPLLLSHVGGALLCGGAVRITQKLRERKNKKNKGATQSPSSMDQTVSARTASVPYTAVPHGDSVLSVGRAALQAAQAMLTACACVTLGFVLSALLSAILRVSPLLDAALSALIEVTGGAKKLCALTLPKGVLLPALAFATGFGGLSIQMQNAAFIAERGVKIRDLCLLWLLRGALSSLLCALLLLFT